MNGYVRNNAHILYEYSQKKRSFVIYLRVSLFFLLIVIPYEKENVSERTLLFYSNDRFLLFYMKNTITFFLLVFEKWNGNCKIVPTSNWKKRLGSRQYSFLHFFLIVFLEWFCLIIDQCLICKEEIDVIMKCKWTVEGTVNQLC